MSSVFQENVVKSVKDVSRIFKGSFYCDFFAWISSQLPEQKEGLLSNFHLFFLLLTNSPEVNDDTAEALKPNFIWAISCLYYVYLSWLQGGYVKHYIWYMPRWWSFEEKKGWFVKDDRAIPSGSLKKNR